MPYGPDMNSAPGTSLLDKYRPATSAELVANAVSVLAVRQWVRKYAARAPDMKKGLIVSGPSGIGLSLTARLVLQEAGYHVLEINSLQVRSKDEMHRALQDARRMPLDVTGKRKALLVEELESLTSLEGSVQELMAFLNPHHRQQDLTHAAKRARVEAHW